MDAAWASALAEDAAGVWSSMVKVGAIAPSVLETLPLEEAHCCARLPIAGSNREWVIVNIHLAAFDKEAVIRRRQLADIIRFAKQEYAKGNAVVVGGDWNMEFERDRFPHRTAIKDRFWLHDFPLGDLPRGWNAAFDSSIPSVRTAHKPYVAGENYVTVVDGFIVSPEVEVEEIRAIDRSFRHSDHQPVFASLRLRKHNHMDR